jgi:rhodanese-related sulfurtransferase
MSIPKFLSGSVLFFSALFLTSTLCAGNEEKAQTPTPNFIRGGKVISTVEAKTFFSNKEAEFYDVRSMDEFGKAHIHGARVRPYQENSECVPDFNPSADQFDLDQLPPNKGKTVIFYCNGPTGWKSYKASVLAIRTGYRDVMWLRDGFSGWESARFPVE